MIGLVVVPVEFTVSDAVRVYVPALTLMRSPAVMLANAVVNDIGVAEFVELAYVSVPVEVTYRSVIAID